MKDFFNKFRDIGNKHIGFMLIPQHIYAGDKQLHTIKGGITAVSYFILNRGLNVANGWAILLSFVIVVGLAYLWEKFKSDKINHYDVIADVVGWFLLVIVGGQIIYNL